MTLTIMSATVLVRNYQADHIIIYTDLPGGRRYYLGRQTLEMSTDHGTGEQYVIDNFHITPSVISDDIFKLQVSSNKPVENYSQSPSNDR